MQRVRVNPCFFLCGVLSFDIFSIGHLLIFFCGHCFNIFVNSTEKIETSKHYFLPGEESRRQLAFGVFSYLQIRLIFKETKRIESYDLAKFGGL